MSSNCGVAAVCGVGVASSEEVTIGMEIDSKSLIRCSLRPVERSKTTAGVCKGAEKEKRKEIRNLRTR